MNRVGLSGKKHANIAVERDVLRMAHGFAGLASARDVYSARLDRPARRGAWAWRIWQTLRHGKRVECINFERGTHSVNIRIYLSPTDLWLLRLANGGKLLNGNSICGPDCDNHQPQANRANQNDD
jgi:hypothetical protein